jgi:hypothetical protein
MYVRYRTLYHCLNDSGFYRAAVLRAIGLAAYA